MYALINFEINTFFYLLYFQVIGERDENAKPIVNVVTKVREPQPIISL